MSRFLGKNVTRKARLRENSCEEEGRRMFLEGLPCPPRPYSHGKDHAKWRGWQRAATAARTKEKKNATKAPHRR